MIAFLFAWSLSASATRRMPLFETMLEERAFVVDLRATISPPTAGDYLRAAKDWPLSSSLCHRIGAGVENLFASHLLHVGHFYADALPELPRLMMHLEFNHGDMAEPVAARDKRSYTRVLRGSLRVTLLPSGREITGIPLRVALTRATYGEYDKFKSLRLLDVNGVKLVNGPVNGRWDTVRHLNEHVLLDALWNRDGECDRLLF